MKTEILAPYGFCSGVLKAVKTIEKELADPGRTAGRVFLEHPVVHNARINERLQDRHRFSIYSGEVLGRQDLFVISAHGHDLNLKINGAGFRVVDCFCPWLKRRFNEIEKKYRSGMSLFYLGEEKHPETAATLSFIERKLRGTAEFATSPGQLMKQLATADPGPHLVIVQSTFDLDEGVLTGDNLEILRPCAFCSKRWARIKKAVGYRTYVIVGDHSSSNTAALFSAAKKQFKDQNIYLFEDLGELKAGHPTLLEPILLASGTSTSKSDVDDIYRYLTEL